MSTGPPRESESSHYPASSLRPCGPRSSRDVDVRPRPRQTLICSFNSAEDSEASFVFAFASVPFSKKRSLALLQGNQGGAREGLHGDPQVPSGAARSHVCLEFFSGTTGFILPIVTGAAEVPPLGWGLRQAKSSSLTSDPHSRVQPLTPGPRVAGAQALGPPRTQPPRAAPAQWLNGIEAGGHQRVPRCRDPGPRRPHQACARLAPGLSFPGRAELHGATGSEGQAPAPCPRRPAGPPLPSLRPKTLPGRADQANFRGHRPGEPQFGGALNSQARG